ncbi:TagA domain-containing protein [Veronia nyctiphanis]|nr:TagA domain-containing protein [Veronia nyctiphanis]
MREWENKVPDKTYGSLSPSTSDEASVASKLAKYDGVKVHFYNGNWTDNIHIPAASSDNIGKVLTVGHSAGWGTTLHINGGTVSVKSGFAKNYRSDGSQWVEGESLSLTKTRKPIRHGVPVTTLLGYFDPEKQLTSYIYPALHGSYGMVYPDDTELASSSNHCHLAVTTSEGVKNYALANHRFTPSRMNQFHINIETATQPSKAEIICGGNPVVSRALESPRQEPKVYILPSAE